MSQRAGSPDPSVCRRVLLKLSGESLGGESKFGIDSVALGHIGAEVITALETGVQLAIVVGGGNFFRGVSAQAANMDRVVADQVGMLATVMNALVLQQYFEKRGTSSEVFSAVAMAPFCDGYDRRRALKALDSGQVVIFASGTGNPLFTTDSAAALRAIEIGADVMIKGTRVDGIFDDDPERNPEATRFEHISFSYALEHELKVMDATAFALCREHDLPIRVLNVAREGALLAAVTGGGVGTLVDNGRQTDD